MGRENEKMKIRVFFIALLLLSGCREKVAETYFTPEKALYYFSKIEETCNRDGGNLWGQNLYGPMMFIERSTRKITANQPDKEGLLKLRDGVYTGDYPWKNIITISAVEFGGTLYGVAPLPLEEDEFRLLTRAIHSLFHRYQQETGISPEYFNETEMDEREARIWIKLEWKALRKAIDSDGEEQRLAIRDALIFRGSNRETFPRHASSANRFESYEGLATFTYLLLTTQNQEEYRKSLFDYLDRLYQFQSYSRSYGSIHGALYATLMLNKGYDFSTIKSDTVDLARIVKQLYQIELPLVCRDVAGSISMNYNISEIQEEEESRIRGIQDRLKGQLSQFTEKPVVFLELESPSFDFEPKDVSYLDTLGTLYNTIRVSDNWGKLSVDKTGCLVSNNFKNLRITAKGLKSDKNHLYGEGWQIILNEGWTLVESGEHFYIRRNRF